MAETSEHNVQWGVAAWALNGDAVCGDTHVVQPLSCGSLFAVIDGLGHGAQAAEAASAASAVLKRHYAEPLPDIIKRCHRVERELRGVVMSLVRIDAREGQLTWLGVGNVSGMLFRKQERRAKEHLLVRPGIVGANLPRLHVRTLPMCLGDTIVLATDGVDLSALPPMRCDAPLQKVAEHLLHASKTGKDDALVLAARLGEPA